jgi:hypothetical protein
VVAKVGWHQGELFPRVGFIVTDFSKRAKNARIKCLREDVPVVPGAAWPQPKKKKGNHRGLREHREDLFVVRTLCVLRVLWYAK